MYMTPFHQRQQIRLGRLKTEAGAVIKQPKTNHLIEQTLAIHMIRIEEMEKFLWR